MSGLEYTLDYMIRDERKLLERLVSKDKLVKDFIFTWTRWKNWEKWPPVLALQGTDVIAGFHGFTKTKSGYINTLYTWVDEAHRRQSLGADMVDFVLWENSESIRWKLRSEKDSIGLQFWTSFGLIPIGELGNEMLFDTSIANITSVATLKRYGRKGCEAVTEDKRTLSHYKKLGVVYTHPAWVHLNEEV